MSDCTTGDWFLLLSAIVPRSDFLLDADRLESALLKIAQTIQMRAIADPSVLTASNNPGLEGYLAIDASNITISTYLAPPRLVACVHSCRPFDCLAVLSFFQDYYGCVDCRHRVVRECDLEIAKDVGLLSKYQ